MANTLSCAVLRHSASVPIPSCLFSRLAPQSARCVNVRHFTPRTYTTTTTLTRPERAYYKAQYDRGKPWNLLSRTSERNQRQVSRAQRCSYYTHADPISSPYSPAEDAILSAALERVPTHGFTKEALSQGAVDAGYLAASTNLFPRGAFDLVLYHHVMRRNELKDRVQFPTNEHVNGSKPLGTGAKVRGLMLARLRANEPIIHKYQEALALMSLAGNIPASLAELGRLVDEIWYLAGDISVDSSWYTKRGLLAGVYASAEVFMTQDKSKDFIETEEFVDRRLEGVPRLGTTAGAVTEWAGFTAMSAVNVARSFGIRI